MSDWSTKIPTTPGEYYMRDESGGPTLYVFEYVDGQLVCGAKCRDFRFDATWHIKGAEFKPITPSNNPHNANTLD